MQSKHLLVAGATGLVGYAVAKHFAGLAGWQVSALSRRMPVGLTNAHKVSADLGDRDATQRAVSSLPPVTHLVYAAYIETPAAIPGWREQSQMNLNLCMFRNVLDPLLRAGALEHVTLLQGTKAYGAPDARIPVPARERQPRSQHPVFYWLQEDYLREQQAGQPWHWTILRPQIVFGESLGSHMNLIPAIGVYGALLKEAGLALAFPGGASRVREAVDADLLARACEWAGTTEACRNEVFNITNGDVFEWREVWPAIADSLGMACGGDQPLSLAEAMPRRADEWRAIVRKHHLRAPDDLDAFVGQGFAYADRQFCYGRSEPPPTRLVSTIKARQAGFADCIDTEDMFRKWFRRFQELRWLPPR